MSIPKRFQNESWKISNINDIIYNINYCRKMIKNTILEIEQIQKENLIDDYESYNDLNDGYTKLSQMNKDFQILINYIYGNLGIKIKEFFNIAELNKINKKYYDCMGLFTQINNPKQSAKLIDMLKDIKYYLDNLLLFEISTKKSLKSLNYD